MRSNPAAKPPVVNIDDVLADPTLTDINGPRGPFHATLGFIGKALGTKNLGINVTVVPLGKKAWPRHYHFGNDELFVISPGSGTLPYGEGRRPLRSGEVDERHPLGTRCGHRRRRADGFAPSGVEAFG